MLTRNMWMPPTYFKALLVLAIALHWALPFAAIIPSPARYAGIVPMILGIYLNLSGSRAFSLVKTSIKPYDTPEAFVTKGVFRLSRNPMYLGLVGFLFGWSWLLGTLAPFVTPVLMFLILDRKFIPCEEQALATKFGAAFLNYQSEVRRWM
jgi:protein-S-isoprenylcysteine O-methyltransferase Ste14